MRSSSNSCFLEYGGFFSSWFKGVEYFRLAFSQDRAVKLMYPQRHIFGFSWCRNDACKILPGISPYVLTFSVPILQHMEHHGMSTKKLTQQQKKLFLHKHNECQQTQCGATHRD
jgi:hypothetical protein